MSFDALLIEQRLTIGQIQRIVRNYRKIGKDKFSAHKTRIRIAALQELWKKCVGHNVQLHQIVTREELEHDYFKNTEFINAEADFEEAADALHDILVSQEKVTQSCSTSKVANSTMSGEGAGNSSTFALPRVTIPKFNGATAKWESFRDSFKALVGENDSITPAQKLYYLKSFLTDEAALLIEHVTVSDANYDGAWNILVEEYDNLRALVFSHIHAFADSPVMKSENAAELKQLRDVVSSSLAALQNLNRPVGAWDDLLVYIITQKFSSRTRIEWNLRLGASNVLPTYSSLKEFMTERIRGITPHNPGEVNSQDKARAFQGNKSKTKANVHATAGSRHCVCCSKNHPLAYCTVWQNKTIDERFEIAKTARICFNCLKSGYFPQNCPSEKRCVKCRKAHHTLLHRTYPTNSEPSDKTSEEQETTAPSTSTEENAFSSHVKITKYPLKDAKGSFTAQVTNQTAPSVVLLATAWVRLRTKEDRVVKTRALLDQGSSHTFITESLAQQLHTTRCRANLGVNVFGGEHSGRSNSLVKLTLESRLGHGPRVPFVAYVYQKLTSYAASKERHQVNWSHLEGLEMADPHPLDSSPIELLIGADLYGQLLIGPIKKGPLGTPTAQLTALGWIISGPIGAPRDATMSESALHCVTTSRLDQAIRQFWETEEIPSKSFHTPDEQACEEHFVKTHSRDSQGRYIVRLPFRQDAPPKLGESYQIALNRYAATERRLRKNKNLADAYAAFLEEYESLGHMEQVQTDCGGGMSLYMPHHPVMREDSATTRLRVVFNASSATSNGTSLNDHLLIGEKLQQEIASVLLRWRQHCFVYTADIAKMFRQIWIHPDETDFQRIVWKSKDSDIRSYRLLTVTYGTACARKLLTSCGTLPTWTTSYSVPMTWNKRARFVKI